MKVHLRTPDRGEAVIDMTLLPKVGEQIDFAGSRYVVVSVTHSVDASRTTIEVVQVDQDELRRKMKLNEMVRYRTTEIRAFSPPARPRMIR